MINHLFVNSIKTVKIAIKMRVLYACSAITVYLEMFFYIYFLRYSHFRNIQKERKARG